MIVPNNNEDVFSTNDLVISYTKTLLLKTNVLECTFKFTFLLLDFLFVILLFSYLNHFHLMVFLCFYLVACIFGHRKLRVLLLLVKEPLFFIVIACQHGTRYLPLNFMFGITIIQSAYLVGSVYWGKLLLILCIIFFEGLQFSLKGIDSVEKLGYTTELIILYIYTSATLHIAYFKLFTVVEQSKLSEISIELEKREKEELCFVRRISHFSKTSLNGIVNPIYFIKNILSYMDIKQNPERLKTIEKWFSTIDMCMLDFKNQSSDIISFYLMLNSTQLPLPKKNFFPIRDAVQHVVKVQKNIRLGKRLKEEGYKNVRIVARFDSDLPYSGYFDLQRLLQVLTNMISNAIKFSKSYEKRGVVEVSVFARPGPIPLEGGNVGKDKEEMELFDIEKLKEEAEEIGLEGEKIVFIHFQVRDNGVGIEPRFLGEIFKPFSEVHGDENIESFSLGLNISRNFTQKFLGGQLHIHSGGISRGTTATLIIPTFTKESEKEDGSEAIQSEVFENFWSESSFKESALRKELDRTGGRGKPPDLKNLKFTNEEYPGYDGHPILMVDDMGVSLNIIKKQVNTLTNFQNKLYTAQNGREALLVIWNKCVPRSMRRTSRKKSSDASVIPPHVLPVVFTDIDMPVMDGKQLVGLLRRMFGNNIVVLAVTATLTSNQEKYREKYKFDGVVSKPVGAGQMKEILNFVFKERDRRIRKFKSSKGNIIFSHKFERVDKKKKKKKKKKKRKKKKKEIIDHWSDSSTDSSSSDEDESFEFLISEEEDDEHKEVKRLTKEGVGGPSLKEEILVCLFAMIMNSLVGLGCYVYCTPEQYSNWLTYFLISWITAPLVQCLLTFLVWKSGRNYMVFTNFLTALRVILACNVGSLYIPFQLTPKVFLTQLSFVAQVCQSTSSVLLSLFLTIIMYAQSIYFEWNRKYETHIFCFDSPLRGSDDEKRFYDFLDFLGSIFYSMLLIQLTSIFEDQRRQRKQFLETYITKKRKLEKNFNVSISKISHDMLSPVSALAFLSRRIGAIFEKSFFKREKIKRRGKIIYRFNRSFHVDGENFSEEDLNTLYDLQFWLSSFLKSSVVLSVSISNFLNSCKIRNRKIQYRKNQDFKDSSQQQFNLISIEDVVISVFNDLHWLRDMERLRVIELEIPKTFYYYVEEHNIHKHDFRKVMKVRSKRKVKNRNISYDAKNVRLILKNLVMNSLIHSGAKKITFGVKKEMTQNTHHGKKYNLVFFVKEVKGKKIINKEMVEEIIEDVRQGKKLRFQDRSKKSLGLGLVNVIYLVFGIGGKIEFGEEDGGNYVTFTCPILAIRDESQVLLEKEQRRQKQLEEEEEEEDEGEEDDDTLVRKYLLKHGKGFLLGEDDRKKKDDENPCEWSLPSITGRSQKRDDYATNKLPPSSPTRLISSMTTVSGGGSSNSPRIRRRIQDVRVMFVEDQSFLHQIYESFFIRAGFRKDNLRFVCCPQRAMGILNNNRYEMLFTDLFLGPGKLSGVEMVNTLETWKLPELVILATGNSINDPKSRSPRIHEILSKPIRVEEIRRIANFYTVDTDDRN